LVPSGLRRLRPLLKERWAPEAVALGTRVAYLWCARGVARSPVWAAADRALDGLGTARNISTMTKLMAAVEESPSCGVENRKMPHNTHMHMHLKRPRRQLSSADPVVESEQRQIETLCIWR